MMDEEKFYKDRISKMLSAVHNADWLLKIYSFIKVFADDAETAGSGSAGGMHPDAWK